MGLIEIKMPTIKPDLFHDDFEDNKVTGRASNYRPEWTVVSGSPSASGGILKLPAGDTTVQTIQITSNITKGVWEIKVRSTASATAGRKSFRFWKVDANNYYQTVVYSRGDGGIYLYKIEGGTSSILGKNVPGNPDTRTTDWLTIKVIHDGSGNFSVYMNGNKQFDATDSSPFTTCNYVEIENTEDVETEWDDLRVYQE